MSSSEGGREIQLAKERLASAKARVESASKTFVAAKETKKQIAKAMEIATNGVNTAQLELLSSQNEVKKAAESLKAAEKRREVVNIDTDSDEEEGNSNNKKRKKGSNGSPSKSPMMKECNRILSKLKSADKSETGGIFSVPVEEDDNTPAYSQIITEPSDFGTIQARLDANEIEAPEFHRLVSLVFTNALTHNPDADHFVHRAALKLQTIYDKERQPKEVSPAKSRRMSKRTSKTTIGKEKSRSATRDNVTRGRQSVQFAVGQRVLVWCDKTNDHWKATILSRKEMNGNAGYNIHYEGAKRKEKGKQDWVPWEDITASAWE